MPSDKKLYDLTSSLLDQQKLAVLATETAGQPYCSLVAFVHGAGLKEIYFATERDSSKYAHLTANARVALLIDNRKNSDQDFDLATAIQAMGMAQECDGQAAMIPRALFLRKHPTLQAFIDSPQSVFFCVHVNRYIIVRELLQVQSWTP